MKRLVPLEKCYFQQRPVLAFANDGTPTKGNRYIVGGAQSGEFATFNTDAIVTYDGTDWQVDTPEIGWVCYNLDKGYWVYYDGSQWQALFAIPHGTFSSEDSQYVANTSLAQAITFSHNDEAFLITHTLDDSKIYFDEPGCYEIIISLVYETGEANKHLNVWIRQNGTDIDRSNRIVHITSAAAESVMTVAITIEVENADEYIEVMMSSDSTTVGILATAAGSTPTRPACPSIILTVQKIADIEISTIGEEAPFDQTDLILWFDSSDTDSYTVDGSNNLLTLLDKTPVSPATVSFPVGKAPVKNVVTTLNGYPTFQFNGSKKIKTTRTANNDTLSIIMVCRWNGTAGNNGSVVTHDLSDSGTAATYNHFVFGTDGASTLLKEYVGNGSAFDSPLVAASTLNFNTWYIVGVRNTGSNAYAYINGASWDNGAHTKTELITLSVADQGYRPFSGFMTELIIFDGDIGETRLLEVMSYLNTKYAVY